MSTLFWLCFIITVLLLLSQSTTHSMSMVRNAVVTGANKGIGLEICKQLSQLDGNDGFQSIYALCRKTSPDLTKLAECSQDNIIKVVEGIEVANEDVDSKLQSIFQTQSSEPTPIHLLIHNAGAYGPPENFNDPKDVYSSQSLQNITRERMRFALELNTLAPLFVTQALLPNIRAAGGAATTTTTEADVACGKVIIVSSLMGSMTDNTSGGHYAYRSAKAGVNMIGKSLAEDLKKDRVAVGMIHPGFVYTGFGGDDTPRMDGQRDVDVSVKGVLQAIDQVSLENTGCFVHGGYGEGVKPLQW